MLWQPLWPTVTNVTRAFWDASAIVPLCLPQAASKITHRLRREYGLLVVWWGTPVEARAGLSRLVREEEITTDELQAAVERLTALRRAWREIAPTEKVRDLAESFPERHELRAGDAFQLAAAMEWCDERPRNRPFVCFDRRLAKAAAEIGFTVIGETG